ncbi:hypothetical protein CPB85DRAFT_1357454, partial [Mucidula mucida]
MNRRHRRLPLISAHRPPSFRSVTVLLHRDTAPLVRDCHPYHTVVLDGKIRHRLFVQSCESHSLGIRFLLKAYQSPSPRRTHIICHHPKTPDVLHRVDVFAPWFFVVDVGDIVYPIKALGSMSVRRLSLLTRLSISIEAIPPTVTHLELSYTKFSSCGWTEWGELFRRCPHLTHVHFRAYWKPVDLDGYSICHFESNVSLFQKVLNAPRQPSRRSLVRCDVSHDDDVRWEGAEDVARNIMSTVTDKRF